MTLVPKRKLLVNAQRIVNGVQDGVLPLDISLHAKHALRFASAEHGERPNRLLCSRNYGQTFLELRYLLGEKFDSDFPRKRIRRHDEPLRAQGEGGSLCAHVQSQASTLTGACCGIVATDRVAWGTGDECIDIPVRARRGRTLLTRPGQGQMDRS